MGIRSEYQKHFKVSALRKSLPNYYENVAFRTARKEREYAHTPLSWYAEETNSVDSDSGEDDKATKTEVVESGADAEDSEDDECVDEPQKTYLVKPEILNDLKLDSADDDQPVICDEEPAHKRTILDKKTSTSTKGIKNKTTVIKPGKPRRPDRKQKIAPRPSSQGPSKHKSTRCRSAPLEHPAPFLSYGWGDLEPDLCQHKTFNVKATADVYPAALAAQARRKTVCQRRAASVKKSADDKLKAMLEAASRAKGQEIQDWKSEYQQRYPAYDTQEYIRGLSARANDRRLDRIVYVP